MAQELWDLHTSDNRSTEDISIFIIFCEDGFHEPSYFRSFDIEGKLKINAVPRQGHAIHNFFNAVEYCKEKGLMDTVDGVDKLKENTSENIWCVYDRDENKSQPNAKAREDFEFNTAIKNAADAGLKVAWSNDSFELWVLLHFEPINSKKTLSRNDIYNRLTSVFLTTENLESNTTNIIGIENFYYKKHLKPFFGKLVLPLLKERTDIAIENARALAVAFDGNIRFHDRNPCTMVHHLVNDLLLYSK